MSAVGSTKWTLRLVSTSPPYTASPVLFAGQGIANTKLHWVDDTLLEIRYDSAFVNSFSNYWHTEIQGRKAIIELRLMPRYRIGGYHRGVAFRKTEDGRVYIIPLPTVVLQPKKRPPAGAMNDERQVDKRE